MPTKKDLFFGKSTHYAENFAELCGTLHLVVMPNRDVVSLHCQSMTMRASAALAEKLQTGLHFARLHEPCHRIKELPSQTLIFRTDLTKLTKAASLKARSCRLCRRREMSVGGLILM